jgi:two-component system sensor histidine kinase AtoS
MKKKITAGLIVVTLLFILGGIYLIVKIEKATSTLDNLITLHQVEILREQLLIHVKRVQLDLNMKNTRYARNVNKVIENVMNMERVADSCMDCHHTDNMQRRLIDMQSNMREYKKAVSRVFTIRANARRMQLEEDRAFKEGEHIVTMVNEMISMASSKLEIRTQTSLREISRTKYILFVLVSLGPLSSGVLAYIFIKGFTGPVNSLLKATKKIKDGDLDFRIEGLKDEFGTVASSFNEMAHSLNLSMRKIEESEKRYRLLFESAGDAIFILVAEGEHAGRIISANRAAAEMHGYTVEEILELNIINDLDIPDDARKAPDIIKRILDGEWIKDELFHRRKDGSVFPVEVSAGLLEFMDHKYILAIDRDVTESKSIEESLKRAEQMKLVGEWAAGLAHEIKNSLAGIKISVEVLTRVPNFPQNEMTSMYKVLDEIKRIEKLLKSLLKFAKPPKLQLLLTNVKEILENAIGYSIMQSSENVENKINIVKEYGDSLPRVMVDRLQLRQVFMNILINAAEAMHNSGTITVHTEYNKEKEILVVDIADTGEGINESKLHNMFRPFFTTKSKGTGLGLAISRRIIEEHGGHIRAENREGGGAVFHIGLPVRKQKEQTA